MSWDELIGRFCDRLRSTGRSPQTVRLYRAILGESVMAATFIPTSGVIQDQRRDSDMHAAFDRFFHGFRNGQAE